MSAWMRMCGCGWRRARVRISSPTPISSDVVSWKRMKTRPDEGPMMARYRFTALAFAAVTAMALMTPLPAAAQSAEDLRRDGQACELPNGYMRAIDNSVRSVVE